MKPGEDMLMVSTFTKALDALRSDICSKIEVAVSEIQADTAVVREDLTSSEATLQRSVDEQGEISATATGHSVSALETAVRDLQAKCDDIKNRPRRNNIRIIGIPEDLEDTAPTEFISSLLQDLLHL